MKLLDQMKNRYSKKALFDLHGAGLLVVEWGSDQVKYLIKKNNP